MTEQHGGNDRHPAIALRVCLTFALVVSSFTLTFWLTDPKGEHFVFFLVDTLILSIVFGPVVYFWLIRPHVRRSEDSILAFKLAETRFREFSDTASAWLWETDADFHFTYVSAGVERVLGIDAERIIGKQPWEQRGFDKSSEQFARHRADIDNRRAFSDFRYPVDCPDGQTRWVEIGGNPVFDKLGRFIGYRGTGRDVTDQVDAQAQNVRLRRLVEESASEIYVFETQTLRYMYANSAACRNLGYSKEELRKLTPLDLMPEYEPDTLDELVGSLLNGQRDNLHFETVQKRKDGTTYIADVNLQILRSDYVSTFAAIITDITEQRNLFNLLKATVDHFPGGISVMDKDQKLILSNGKFYELLGLPEDRFPIGSLFPDIVRYAAERGDFGPGDVEKITARRLALPKTLAEVEMERMRPDGTAIEIRGYPLAEGGYVLTYVDITSRKTAELELIRHRDHLEDLVRSRTAQIQKQSNELAEALEREKEVNELQRQFVSMASHEFRTPLAIIDSSAQRLQRKRDRVTAEEVLLRVDKIRQAVSRMTELMESTLAAAKADSGRIELRLDQPCDLRGIVAGCCQRRSELSKSHRIDLDIDALPDTVPGDTHALEQVFSNLLSNAVKYSPGADRVDVRGWVADGFVHVSVRDYGLGMDEEDLGRMFERYFRAKTSTGIPGTGIGLNLVKMFVEQHRGSVEVASEEGEGCTFTVRLPLMDEAALPESACA